MVLNSLFWCFEVQCESSSYRSPKEAPAAITFGLPDVHPSQNQTEGQALCVDSWQLVDGRVPGVVEPTCERRSCRSRDGTCSEWLYCRLGDDPSLSGSCDYIDSYIPTGVLQYWYHFLSLCPCFSSVKLCYQVTASLSFGTCDDARLWGSDSHGSGKKHGWTILKEYGRQLWSITQHFASGIRGSDKIAITG